MSIHQEREYLLYRAKRFYETACMQMDKGFFDLAAFSLEQSIQLHLKACL
ncbi:MAG: HEPN domain-containing protein [Candidatus Bathyarchaeia archaeon]